MTKAILEHIHSIIYDNIPEEHSYHCIVYEDGEVYSFLCDDKCFPSNKDLDESVIGALEEIPEDVKTLDVWSTEHIIKLTCQHYSGLRTEYLAEV